MSPLQFAKREFEIPASRHRVAGTESYVKLRLPNLVSPTTRHIDFRIRGSKNPYARHTERVTSIGFVRILPRRKEARGSRGTHAMRRSDSGDLWCHSLNSAGPNDDFLPAMPGRRVFQIRTYRRRATHGRLGREPSCGSVFRERRTSKQDSPPPSHLVVGRP